MLSEKVDTTLSKGVLRIGGTVVGGSLGEHRHLLTLTWTGTVGNITVRPLPSRVPCNQPTAGPRNALQGSWCHCEVLSHHMMPPAQQRCEPLTLGWPRHIPGLFMRSCCLRRLCCDAAPGSWRLTPMH